MIMKRSYHRFWVFNSLFWITSYVLLLFLFSGRKSPEKIDFIYTSCFIVSLVVPVLVNIYVYIPKFLKKEKYLLFLVLFIANLILFAELNPLFFELVISSFFNDYYFISYHNKLEIYFIFFLFFTVSSLIWLAEDWIYLNKLEKDVLKREKQQIEKQLYYLKGQINPHFLFNALNVIYALSIEKKNVSNAILQLSDILRYVIYDTEVKKVGIVKEIELLENYIAFEKNRHNKNANIQFNYSVHKDAKIYPMLFLPLVENSFKHGLKSKPEKPFISIQLNQNENEVSFTISNNFTKKDKPEVKKGIGLKNIQESLQLIYPKKHSFTTNSENNIFTAILKINLDK